jgi:2-dehydropantoate 2-reductase
MKICFFGVGGVGGYFGALLASKYRESHDIYFVARGSHGDAIRKNGLTLKKGGGNEIINVRPKWCADTVDDVPVCDLVVVSVKSYDLSNAVEQIAAITGATTVILPLLNGVDIYDRIRKRLSAGYVLPSCVYVGTHIESPGIIFQKGGSCKILIGKDPHYPEYYPKEVLGLFEGAKIDFKWEDNVAVSIWSKFMFIAAYGLVSAVHDKTLGEITADPELCGKVTAIMSEIETISRKLNVALAPNIVAESFAKAKQFSYETKTSFQRDVELKGKVNEGDLFGGTVIRYGEALNAPTPTTAEMYDKLIKKCGSIG